jgi:uncharacterized protein YcfJ
VLAAFAVSGVTATLVFALLLVHKQFESRLLIPVVHVRSRANTRRPRTLCGVPNRSLDAYSPLCSCIPAVPRWRRPTEVHDTIEHTMKLALKTSLALTIGFATTHAMAQQITLYQDDAWHGRVYATSAPVSDLGRVGFNDRASSVIVDGGGWEVCDDANFQGNCRVLRQGSYASLRGMGMNDRISSLRPVSPRGHYENEAPAPMSRTDYEYRQRPQERLYDAQVRSVHAVVGAADQRCWIEREQVSDSGNHSNVGGGIAGALIGGVLGHQIGGGTGRDVATVGGALAGAAIGSNMGSGNGSYGRETRRCKDVASTRPQYWDVVYDYRGVEHQMQLASAPGRTIQVNRNGLPRQ